VCLVKLLPLFVKESSFIGLPLISDLGGLLDGSRLLGDAEKHLGVLDGDISVML